LLSTFGEENNKFLICKLLAVYETSFFPSVPIQPIYLQLVVSIEMSAFCRFALFLHLLIRQETSSTLRPVANCH